MERYYQEEIECAPREKIKAIQDERLVKQVQHVWDNVPYYRKKMEEKGVTPADIKSRVNMFYSDVIFINIFCRTTDIKKT